MRTRGRATQIELAQLQQLRGLTRNGAISRQVGGIGVRSPAKPAGNRPPVDPQTHPCAGIRAGKISSQRTIRRKPAESFKVALVGYTARQSTLLNATKAGVLVQDRLFATWMRPCGLLTLQIIVRCAIDTVGLFANCRIIWWPHLKARWKKPLPLICCCI